MGKHHTLALKNDRNDWATPQSFIDLVERKLGLKFNLDACAYDHTAKAPEWFTEEDDALTKDWRGTVWMNPPYGKTIPAWVEYAYEQSVKHGSTVVCLLPARTETRWFHYVVEHGEVILLKKRILFEHPDGVSMKGKGNFTIGSVLAIFGPRAEKGKIGYWDWSA